MDADRVLERCRLLAAITDVQWETTRTFLSPAMRRANDAVAEWMRSAGLTVWMDAAGNLRGRRGQGGTLLLGSHLDTVPNAGAFDGVLGVMMALEIAEEMRDEALPFALEVVAFSDEEGVRFGVPFLGSRAITGTLDDVAMACADRAGVSVREAIGAYGLAASTLQQAVVHDALAYFEVHIEQGPVLESEALALGVVETVAGQSRYALTFFGDANHAGTTPMRLRHDALAAAAAWAVEVEQIALATPSLVATVGRLETVRGAGNVIAGEVRASLDVRHPLDSARTEAAERLLLAAKRAGEQRGVRVEIVLQLEQAAVPLDPGLLRLLEDAVDGTGVPVRRMVSGAGHDAMVLAPHMPAAMLFLRTPGGVSHHPAEAVLRDDVDLGLRAGLGFVRALLAREKAR